MMMMTMIMKITMSLTLLEVTSRIQFVSSFLPTIQTNTTTAAFLASMNRRIIITRTTIITNLSSSSFLTAVSSPKINTVEPGSGGTDTRKKNCNDNSFPSLSINADVDDTTATNDTNNKRVLLVLEVWEEVFLFDACKKLHKLAIDHFEQTSTFPTDHLFSFRKEMRSIIAILPIDRQCC